MEKLLNSAANFFIGVVLRHAFGPRKPPQALRRNFDFLSGVSARKLSRKYPNARFTASLIDGIEVELIEARPGARQEILLYFHGGGYFMGSIAAYRRNALRLSYRTGCKVLLFNYPLAPESPFPEALESAVKVYESLLKQYRSQNIYFGGDSAGGGLLLSTLLKLRDENRPLPERYFCLSPWADLTGQGKSMETNARHDVWLGKKAIDKWSVWYAPKAQLAHPYCSPVFGDYRGFPRGLLLVGELEVLLDDAVRVQEKMAEAGVPVQLLVGKQMQHNWPFAFPGLPESKKALAVIADFFAPAAELS